MLRRRLLVLILVLFAVLGTGAAVYAQLESSDRGILPLDTSNTLESGSVHVDVGGPDAESARLAGWRMAQRLGFRALWAKIGRRAGTSRRRRRCRSGCAIRIRPMSR